MDTVPLSPIGYLLRKTTVPEIGGRADLIPRNKHRETDKTRRQKKKSQMKVKRNL